MGHKPGRFVYECRLKVKVRPPPEANPGPPIAELMTLFDGRQRQTAIRTEGADKLALSHTKVVPTAVRLRDGSERMSTRLYFLWNPGKNGANLITAFGLDSVAPPCKGAPPLDLPRFRFDCRPNSRKAELAQPKGETDLIIGADYVGYLPKYVDISRFPGDDLILMRTPLEPGELVFGEATADGKAERLQMREAGHRSASELGISRGDSDWSGDEANQHSERMETPTENDGGDAGRSGEGRRDTMVLPEEQPLTGGEEPRRKVVERPSEEEEPVPGTSRKVVERKASP
jgi:hypothetical protein